MNRRHTKSDCAGCINDYYNSQKGGCYLFPSNMVMRRRVPIQQPPPFNQKAQAVPSCKHEEGYAFLPAEPIQVGPNIDRLRK